MYFQQYKKIFKLLWKFVNQLDFVTGICRDNMSGFHLKFCWQDLIFLKNRRFKNILTSTKKGVKFWQLHLETRHTWDFAPGWNYPCLSSHTFYLWWNFTPGWFHLGLRAPSHVKFHLGKISTRVEKNWCHTWVSTRGKRNSFLLHFTPGWKYVCKNLRHILQKCYTEKVLFVCS